MTNKPTELVVTQADRDAAAANAVLVEMRELILAGKADHHAEPWAAHRRLGIEQGKPMAGEWQDIATAPKDGTIRLWNGFLQTDAFWQEPGVISEEGFWCHFLLGQYDFVEVVNPTHWMPLPAPPLTEQREEG